MKKIFIDCGYHLGEGLKEFTGTLNIDSTWEVYAFEANPYCEIEKKINQHPFKVNAYNKAVWINNGTTIFNCQNQNQSSSPKENSTHILDGWGSCLSEINSSHTYETQEQIETIDFSEFLKQFEGCEIFIKMDIEGAEFEILRKMIEEKTISLVKELWVEWHDIDLNNENESSKNLIINEISKSCKINNWK